MYNEQLEKLIEMALMDGELTEKEKQILFKKAESFGIDLDEFELVLEGKLHARQKEGVHTKKADNVMKCPSCGDIIPALSNVCPSCGFVVNARKKSSEDDKGLEDLIADIENTLVEIKSIKPPNVFATILQHYYITVPILSVLIIAVGMRFQQIAIGSIGLILFWVGIYLIVKKVKADKDKKTIKVNQNDIAFNSLKATFQKHSRTAKTSYGENKKVKLLLDELNTEFDSVETKYRKGKVTEYSIYGIIILAIISVFLIPRKETITAQQVRQTILQHINEGDVKKAEEYYMLHTHDESNGVFTDYSFEEEMDNLAITIMQAFVDKGLLEDAESFLSKGHTSYKLDDIAKPLVMAYIKKNDIESAKRIISLVPHQDVLNEMLPESNEKPKTQNKAVSKPKDIIQEDAGKFVTANVARVYFYDEPAMNSRTDNFFVRGQKAKIIEDYGDFIEVDFEYKGNHTKGFVLTYEVTQ